MNILLTGGAGFIGSHTIVELRNAGHDVFVVDNFSNSKPESLARVESITGRKVQFETADVCDAKAMEKVFSEHEFDAVIHFAGLKAVGESVSKPLEYYRNNLDSTLTLLETMKRHGCSKLIFSSSATVYGTPSEIPITEKCPKGICTNPYGETKSMIERILTDFQAANPEWSIVILRYFNPIGAHPSGLIGESPQGIPNNLMPYITQTAIGRRKELSVFGNDYPTADGTGVRDFIHVVDLACGHVAALLALEKYKGVSIYNLGTGHGYSVLDVVKAFEKANGIKIPFSFKDRRPGDIATCYCNPDKAFKELGWKAERNLEQMCLDSWNFQKNNPEGI